MAHATPAPRANSTWSRPKGNNAQARANYTNSKAATNNTHPRTNRAATAGSVNPSTTANAGTTLATSNSRSPNTYTYGYGNGAHRYRAYGYGNGYRNRSYGNNYGYGRSQGNNRAAVARLRSVHSSLARIDHDYQGHRVRAMHAISMAIRQLSHRSMGTGGMGGFIRHEQRPGHGNAAGCWRRRWRTPAPADVSGPIRRTDEPGSAYSCRGSTCSSAVRETTPPVTAGPADISSVLSTSSMSLSRFVDAIPTVNQSLTASSDLEIKSPLSATSIK